MSKKHPFMDEIVISINYHPYLDEHWKHPNLDVIKYIPILEYWKHPNLDADKYIPILEYWKHPNLDVDKYIPILEYWKHPNVDVNATFSLYIEKVKSIHLWMKLSSLSTIIHIWMKL